MLVTPSPAMSSAPCTPSSGSTSASATPTPGGLPPSERLGSLASLLDDARAGHQDWLRRMFGARLPAPPTARRRAVNALHAATDVYTWKLLRRDLGLSRADTEQTIVQLVEGILEPATQRETS